MPMFRVRCEREDTLTMVVDFDVEAADEAEARNLALKMAQDEANEHQWSENDSGEGEPEVAAVRKLRERPISD